MSGMADHFKAPSKAAKALLRPDPWPKQPGYSVVAPHCPAFLGCDNPCLRSRTDPQGDVPNTCEVLTFFVNEHV